MSCRSESSSSAMLLSVIVTLLGAVMIRLAGVSHTSLMLGVLVLAMGLAAMAVSLLRTGRTSGRAQPPMDMESIPSKTTCPAPRRTAASMPSVMIEPSSPVMLTYLMESFDRWWKTSSELDDLWLAFDRWLRDTMHEQAGARRIRCFRVSGPDHRLASLAALADDPVWLGAAHRGLINHAIASGRAYLHGSREGGELARQLAREQPSPANAEHAAPPKWVLPLCQNGHTIGLMVAGELEADAWQCPDFLRAAGHVLELIWRQVQQESELRAALQTDRASGVLNRADLTLQAEKVLQEAALDEEPSVLLAVSIEGIRRLDDNKHWDLQNWLMQQIGRALRKRLRTDDIIGRFSEDRFVAVLRRLDLSLGELIGRKVLAAIKEAIQHGDAPLPNDVRVRCGLAGDTHCGFDEMLGRAFDALQEARQQHLDISSCGGGGHPPASEPSGMSVGAAT